MFASSFRVVSLEKKNRKRNKQEYQFPAPNHMMEQSQHSWNQNCHQSTQTFSVFRHVFFITLTSLSVFIQPLMQHPYDSCCTRWDRRRGVNAMKLKCCISVRCIMINTLSLFMLKAKTWHAERPQSTLRFSTLPLYLTVIDADYVRHPLYNYLSWNMPRPPPSSFDKCFPSEFTSSPPYKKFRGFLPKAIAPGSNLIMNTTTVYTLPAFVPVI